MLTTHNAMVSAAEKYGWYPLDISSADTPPIQYQSIMSLHFSRMTEESRRQEEWHLDGIAGQTCLGNMPGVEKAVGEALEARIPPECIFEGLCQSLTRATDLFYQERYFHPEMERADRAFQLGGYCPWLILQT